MEAFDYILKPYDEKRIAAMLHKLELAFKRDHAPVEQHVEDGPAPTADGSAAHGELVRERDTNSHTDRRINLLRNDNIIVTDTADTTMRKRKRK